ncbi:MAG: hypothetical protein RR063_11000 [Anaerovoracaceae bacterium]
MASIAPKKESALPYGTTSDNIVKLLDAIKNKQGDEKGIKAVYTGAKFDSTQASLETLKIISGLSLTNIGKCIAFETDQNKKSAAYLKAVLDYAPYEYFLTYIMQGNSVSETDVEALKNYWGKNGYGTANNRSEAAPVCFSILQLAGLGAYIIGRKGKSTRFVWKENFSNIITQFQSCGEQFGEPIETSNAVENEEQDQSVVSKQISADGGNDKNTQTNLFINGVTTGKTIVPANLEITVDMTEWDLDRIEKFFQIIQGEHSDRE